MAERNRAAAWRSLSQWTEVLQRDDGNFLSQLKWIYGDDEALLMERKAAYLRVLERYKKVFSPGEGLRLVRVPGRLNALAMHVDHRGGFINPIAIQRESVLCYEENPDDLVEIYNVNAEYPPRTFRISAEEPAHPVMNVDKWLAVTQQLTDRRIAGGTNNDWVNKVKAVPVYLQRMVAKDRKLKGFKGVFSGDIPARIGLSSSSSIVVAVLEAMMEINKLSIDREDYAYHAGVAEWFVGTRGGFGDHAAMLYGKQGMITHMKTTPELIIDCYIPFPRGYSIVVFHSGIEADKTGAAGQKFNEKTATFEIGEIFIRKYMLEHHRDVYERIISTRAKLGRDIKKFHLEDIIENLNQQEIYKMLFSIPKTASRSELRQLLPDEKEALEKQFSTHHEPPDKYRLRAVCTYGLAECERGRILGKLLMGGKINEFGNLMNISHDGDRVSNISPRLSALKEDPDPSLELYLQPGDYNCSTEEIDAMVDIALASGATGAQVSAAGLGGSMMALVENRKEEDLIRAMRDKYYEPKKIKENYLKVFPIEGAGHL